MASAPTLSVPGMPGGAAAAAGKGTPAQLEGTGAQSPLVAQREIEQNQGSTLQPLLPSRQTQTPSFSRNDSQRFSTTNTFACAWEENDWDQNKHQNLGLTYCLTQINSNPVNDLGTNKIIISNDYRAAGVTISSCLTSPIKAWGDRQITGLGFDSTQYFSTSFSLNLLPLCWNPLLKWSLKDIYFPPCVLIRPPLRTW